MGDVKDAIEGLKVDQTRMGEEVWKNSDFNVKKKDEEATPRMPNPCAVSARVGGNAASALDLVSGEFDAPPADWREELRSEIAARVQHAALGSGWLNEMVHSTKSP